MRRFGSLMVMGLCLGVINLVLASTTSTSLAQGAEHPIPLKYFCESSNDNSCIQSLEYFNKDRPDLGFVDLGIPTLGVNGTAVFDTAETSFTTENGALGVPISAWASIFNLTGGYTVPGFSNSDGVGVIGGPTWIPVMSTGGVRFGIYVGENNGPTSEVAGYDRKRIGDKFRMKLRIGTINSPTAFETYTSHFSFKTEKVGNFQVLVAEGEVAEYFNARSGADPCGDTSIASAAQNGWETYAYSVSELMPGSVAEPAGYKVRVMSECRPVLPTFNSDGVIAFGLSVPHFRRDGVTPIVGDIEIQLPLSSWSFLNNANAKNVFVSYGGSTTQVAAAISEGDGEVKYVIPNIHFSSPTITVGSKLSGVKGKKFVTKAFLKAAGVVLPKGSILTLSTSSKRICTVLKSQIHYSQNGTCKIRVKIQKNKRSKSFIVDQLFTIAVR